MCPFLSSFLLFFARGQSEPGEEEALPFKALLPDGTKRICAENILAEDIMVRLALGDWQYCLVKSDYDYCSCDFPESAPSYEKRRYLNCYVDESHDLTLEETIANCGVETQPVPTNLPTSSSPLQPTNRPTGSSLRTFCSHGEISESMREISLESHWCFLDGNPPELNSYDNICIDCLLNSEHFAKTDAFKVFNCEASNGEVLYQKFLACPRLEAAQPESPPPSVDPLPPDELLADARKERRKQQLAIIMVIGACFVGVIVIVMRVIEFQPLGCKKRTKRGSEVCPDETDAELAHFRDMTKSEFDNDYTMSEFGNFGDNRDRKRDKRRDGRENRRVSWGPNAKRGVSWGQNTSRKKKRRKSRRQSSSSQSSSDSHVVSAKEPRPRRILTGVTMARGDIGSRSPQSDSYHENGRQSSRRDKYYTPRTDHEGSEGVDDYQRGEPSYGWNRDEHRTPKNNSQQHRGPSDQQHRVPSDQQKQQFAALDPFANAQFTDRSAPMPSAPMLPLGALPVVNLPPGTTLPPGAGIPLSPSNLAQLGHALQGQLGHQLGLPFVNGKGQPINRAQTDFGPRGMNLGALASPGHALLRDVMSKKTNAPPPMLHFRGQQEGETFRPRRWSEMSPRKAQIRRARQHSADVSPRRPTGYGAVGGLQPPPTNYVLPPRTPARDLLTVQTGGPLHEQNSYACRALERLGVARDVTRNDSCTSRPPES